MCFIFKLSKIKFLKHLAKKAAYRPAVTTITIKHRALCRYPRHNHNLIYFFRHLLFFSQAINVIPIYHQFFSPFFPFNQQKTRSFFYFFACLDTYIHTNYQQHHHYFFMSDLINPAVLPQVSLFSQQTQVLTHVI